MSKKPDVCQCCGRPSKKKKSFALDHDHDTDMIRGWLCDSCNLGIGLLGDDLRGLHRAIKYLENAPHIDDAVWLGEDEVRQLVKDAVDLARNRSTPGNVGDDAVTQWTMKDEFINGRWRSRYFTDADRLAELQTLTVHLK